MKLFINTMIVLCLVWGSLSAYAESVINHNVVVPGGQSCPSTWKGSAGDAQESGYSGMGESNAMIEPGIRDCSSCAYDNRTQNCICKTCTDYFN